MSPFPEDLRVWLNQISSPWATVPEEEALWGLERIDHLVKGCTLCQELATTRQHTVFGRGAPRPQLCLIGEAPGANEDQEGQPFVGAAGELLDKILAAAGLTMDEVYILNTIKCRPPGNRAPRPDEILHCRPFLRAQLKILQPDLIACLGATAAHALLGNESSVGQLRGQTFSYDGIPVVCTYHPAFLLRTPEKKREVWQDMQRIIGLLDRTLPERPLP